MILLYLHEGHVRDGEHRVTLIIIGERNCVNSSRIMYGAKKIPLQDTTHYQKQV